MAAGRGDWNGVSRARGARSVSRVTDYRRRTVSRRGGRSRGDQDGRVDGRRARASGLDREHPGCNRAELKRAAVPTPDFEASVLCRPGGPVELLRYSDAVSNPYMGTYLRRKLGYAGLPVPDPNERVAAQGSCEQNVLPAVEEWVESGRGGHDAIGHTQLSDSDGLVLVTSMPEAPTSSGRRRT